MEKKDHILYWAESSKNDMASMRNNFLSGNFDWALFIGHLALEKMLKALWVKNNESNFPPRTHNLLKIAREAKCPLDDAEELFLNRVNNFQLETRYPDYKFDFYRQCTKEFTEDNMKQIETFWLCIQEKI